MIDDMRLAIYDFRFEIEEGLFGDMKNSPAIMVENFQRPLRKLSVFAVNCNSYPL